MPPGSVRRGARGLSPRPWSWLRHSSTALSELSLLPRASSRRCAARLQWSSSRSTGGFSFSTGSSGQPPVGDPVRPCGGVAEGGAAPSLVLGEVAGTSPSRRHGGGRPRPCPRRWWPKHESPRPAPHPSHRAVPSKEGLVPITSSADGRRCDVAATPPRPAAASSILRSRKSFHQRT